MNAHSNEKVQSKWGRISNFILAAIMFSIGMIIWRAGFGLYGSDATLLWASGILFFIALSPLMDAFKGLHK